MADGMTAAEMRATFDRIRYPGITFKVRRGPRRGLTPVWLEANVRDARDGTPITIRREFEVRASMATPDGVIRHAFAEVVRFLAHEAAERFRVDGDLLFNPHSPNGDPDVEVLV